MQAKKQCTGNNFIQAPQDSHANCLPPPPTPPPPYEDEEVPAWEGETVEGGTWTEEQVQWWQLQQDVDWLKEMTVTLQTAQENFHHSLGQVVETAVEKEVSQKFPHLTNVHFQVAEVLQTCSQAQGAVHSACVGLQQTQAEAQEKLHTALATVEAKLGAHKREVQTLSELHTRSLQDNLHKVVQQATQNISLGFSICYANKIWLSIPRSASFSPVKSNFAGMFWPMGHGNQC